MDELSSVGCCEYRRGHQGEVGEGVHSCMTFHAQSILIRFLSTSTDMRGRYTSNYGVAGGRRGRKAQGKVLQRLELYED